MNSAINRFVNSNPELKARVTAVIERSGTTHDRDPSARGVELSTGQTRATALVRPYEYEESNGGFTTTQDGRTVFSNSEGDTFERTAGSEAATPDWAQDLESRAYMLIREDGGRLDKAEKFGEINVPIAGKVNYALEAYNLTTLGHSESITPLGNGEADYSSVRNSPIY